MTISAMAPQLCLLLSTSCMEKVIGGCHEHRSREFVRFLNHLEKNLPADQEVHLIRDTYCTHKSVQWLKPKTCQRFRLHLTLTSSFFALITRRLIRRGTFHCVDELEKAIPVARPLEWRTGPVRLEGVRGYHSRQGQTL